MHRRVILLIAAAVAAGAQSNLPGLAAGVLDQTGLARQAVAAHDRDAAIDHVKRAVATVSEIRQNAPPDSPRPLMIPVYREVETTTTVTPVKHKDAELKKYSSIRGVDGQTTTARLDVTAASDRLQDAQAALASGDWMAADAALGAIQNSVAVTQTAGDMPLRMARQNLELARARVLDGKYSAAEVPLRSAAQALGDYEQRFTGQQAANIEAARQAILAYAARIEHHHDDALGRIDSWTETLGGWPASQ